MNEHYEAHLECCGGKGYCEVCFEHWPCLFAPVTDERGSMNDNICPCDGNPVYAVSHPEESQYSAPRDVLCKDCSLVRCDAYPGACRGENYYD